MYIAVICWLLPITKKTMIQRKKPHKYDVYTRSLESSVDCEKNISYSLCIAALKI